MKCFWDQRAARSADMLSREPDDRLLLTPLHRYLGGTHGLCDAVQSSRAVYLAWWSTR